MSKITLVSPSFSGGGAERVMVTLANTFIELGHQVDFIVLRDQGPYRQLLSDQAHKVVLIPDGCAGGLRGAFRAFLSMAGYIRRSQDRLIMSTIRELNLLCIGANLINLGRAELYIREAATLDHFFDRPSMSDRLIFLLMKVFYRRAKGVIANSEETKKDLVKHVRLSPPHITTIYNPMALETIRATAKNTAKHDHPALVTCGRLIPSKNFEDAIHAFAKVRETRPNAHLKIIGDGPHREVLEQKIHELGLGNDVELTGFLDDPFSAFGCAHVFIQTSLREGFGYVLAEAMACGTPVVCYDSKGAMREILADGRYGSLVPTGDINALAGEILCQLQTPTSPELLNEAVERFACDEIAHQYLNILAAFSAMQLSHSPPRS